MFNAVITILILTSCDNKTSSTTTKPDNSNTTSVTNDSYTRAPLAEDFSYKVIEDKSNEALEKNELTVEINKKITTEQIATLADKFYSSKPKQRRFYIFYLLPGMKKDAGAWAISHFDPQLKIEILGATVKEEIASKKLVDEVEGKVLGKWHEEQSTSADYVMFKKDGKTFMKMIFKNGQTIDDELKVKKVNSGTRYDYKNGKYHGEYFIVPANGTLDFYSKENKKFATATIIN